MKPARGSSHWPRLVGVAAFVAALFLYRSYEDRSVLGLWSPVYAGVLVAAVVLLGAVAVAGWRSGRSGQGRGRGRAPSASSRLLDWAILFWGVSYLLSALDDPETAARILDANVLGSVAPLAALGEWLALCLGLVAAGVWVAPRLGETGRKVLASVGALLVVVVLGEGVLRLRAAVAPQTQGFPTYTSEQWARRYVTLNDEGFRDDSHPKRSPEGERRLLVVGDSYAFGAGVNDPEDRLGEQLAGLLSDRLGERWQSLSAAIPDSDTLDETGYLRRMEPYERDAVLLVYVFNDIDYLAPVTSRTVLTEHQTGLLGRLHPARLAFLNSYLFQELFVRWRLATYALSDEPTPSERAYADDAILDRHLDDLERFVELAARGNVPVWIAPLDVAASDGGRFAARYERFVRRATARGLPILSLADAFDGEDRADLRVNRLDGHPNARANRLAAARLIGPMVEALASREGPGDGAEPAAAPARTTGPATSGAARAAPLRRTG